MAYTFIIALAINEHISNPHVGVPIPIGYGKFT